MDLNHRAFDCRNNVRIASYQVWADTLVLSAKVGLSWVTGVLLVGI